MRHVVNFLIGFIILAGTMIHGLAADLTTAISGSDSVEVGREITLTFSFDIEQPVSRFQARLVYDADLLEILGDPVALGGLNVEVNNSDIAIDSASSLSGSISFMRVTFRAKEAFFADDTTVVSLIDVSAVNAETGDAVSGLSSSKPISAIPVKSDNNYLKSMYTNAGTIDFNRNTFEYSLTVDHEVSRIRIVAVKEDPNATVKEDAMYDLKVYRNVINVVVTAENGEKRTYMILVMRKDALGNTSLLSSNTELKSLSVEGYQLQFSPLITEYRLTVDNIVDHVLVLAEASDDRSSVIIENGSILHLGENRIQVTVVAPNGQSRIYSIFVTRSPVAPVTDLEDLSDIVYLTTASTIEVIMKDGYWLTSDVLDKVRRAGKILNIRKFDDQGKLMYSWTIDGRSLTAGTNLYLRLRQDISQIKNLNELLAGARYRTISFLHEGDIPVGTVVKVYIGSVFPQMSSINLYQVIGKTQPFQLNSQSLRVVDGFVEFEVLAGGEYILTDSIIKQEHPIDMVLVGALITIVALIIALTVLLFTRRKSYVR